MNAHSSSRLNLSIGRRPSPWLFAATLFLLLASQAFAQVSNTLRPPSTSHTPIQVRDGRAKVLTPYDENQMLRISFGLTPPHMAEERKLIDQLHDKKSPEFHKFLTAEQWNAKFAPSAEDEQAVVTWAQAQGLKVTKRYDHRLLVDFEANVGTIEKALGIKINNYEMNGQTYFANDRDPDFPSALVGIIQSINGMNSFIQLRPAKLGVKAETAPRPAYVPGPVNGSLQTILSADGSRAKLDIAMKQSKEKAAARAKAQAAGQPQITNGYYDPTDIYSSEAYDVNALNHLGHCCNPFRDGTLNYSPPEGSVAIASYGDVAYSDVAGFQAQYPYLAWQVFKIGVDGGYTCTSGSDDNCYEVTMDTEWATAWANSFGSKYDTASVYVYEGANFGDMPTLYANMLSDNHARVTSTSWACEEACFGDDGTTNLDNIWTSMVGEGWTLIASSGDNGAAFACGDGDALGFPGSDPNFLAAGGTNLSLDGDSNFVSEVSWTGATWTGACHNNYGGSTGGFSSYFATPSYQSGMGFGSRAVPDMALNAIEFQNLYFDGSLTANAGTSIVAPELAGFFAQENAYGLSIGNVCGSGSSACAPIGNADYYLYTIGKNGAPHYPFYDITSGCNTNDITALYDLGYYCAGTGYDEVTGWGSANALQLAWAINWYDAFANGGPSVTFTGPATNTWFNSDGTVSWVINDNVGSRGGSPTGIAGFTQGWDSIPGDDYSLGRPPSNSSFFAGPQFANGTSGCLQTGSDNGCQSAPSQGCHTAYVEGWNNMGVNSGVQTYGPVCYDNVPPTDAIALTGTKTGSIYTSVVTVHITATDATSGVKGIYYALDGGSYVLYSSPLTISTGSHTLYSVSIDNAGNESSVQSVSFTIESPTTTSLTSSAGTLSYGASVTLKASVADTFGATPAGTVTFREGTNTLGTVTLAGGTASLATTALNVGTQSIKAYYNGTTSDEASTSATLTETVKQAASATTVTSSVNPSKFDTAVTFTALVKSETSGTPSGSVTFKNGGTTLATVALASAKATYTTSALTVGAHAITVSYGGNTNFLTSTSSTLTQTVQQVTTTSTITSSANPSTYEEKVALTVTVKSSDGGIPTGAVTLKDGTTTVGTANLGSGKAVFNLTSTVIGESHYTATYAGNSEYVASTSPSFTQTVDKDATTTTLTSSLNPSTFDKSVTFTATVKPTTTGTPTGTVTFKNSGSTLATMTLASGEAKYTTTTLTAGSHSITATYNDNTDYNSSTSSALTETVDKVTTTTTVVSSLNPSTYEHAVSFTATVASSSGSPTGTVTFKNSGTTLGTVTLSGGKATYSTPSLIVGTHSITAEYNGSTEYNLSTSTTLTETVKAATTTTTLVSSLNPATSGASVKFTATVASSAGKPTGTVNFMDGSTKIGSGTLSNGEAAFTTSSLSVATHSITADYLGVTDYATSKSTTLSEKVNP